MNGIKNERHNALFHGIIADALGSRDQAEIKKTGLSSSESLPAKDYRLELWAPVMNELNIGVERHTASVMPAMHRISLFRRLA